MKITAAIQSIRQSGFALNVENGQLLVEPFSKLSDEQLTFLRLHKDEIIIELQKANVYDLDRHAAEKGAAVRYWRFLHNGVEVDIASGATLAEAHELLGLNSDDTLEALPVTEEPKPLSDEEVSQLLDRAITGLSLSRSQLCAELSDDDMAGIRCGDIQFETIRAYAEIWAKQEPTDITHDIRADTERKIVPSEQVTCARCAHFHRDKTGDGSGIGSCAVKAWKPGRGPCLYPRAKRFCDEFKQREVAA